MTPMPHPTPSRETAEIAGKDSAPFTESPALFIDFKQVTDLLAMFGGEPTQITLQHGSGHSGTGLYAHYTDMPEEGCIFLGNADEEAMPDVDPTIARATGDQQS